MLRNDILSGYFVCPCSVGASDTDLMCQERKVTLDPVIHPGKGDPALTLNGAGAALAVGSLVVPG